MFQGSRVSPAKAGWDKTCDGQTERLKSEENVLHFFAVPTGTVTFTRQYVPGKEMPNWESDCTKLRGLHVSSEGTIEDDGFGLLQVG